MKTRHPSATAVAQSASKKPKVVETETSIAPDDGVPLRYWESETVVIACLQNAMPEGSAPPHGRYLIISPTAEAFDELSKHSPCISQLWVLAADSAGPSMCYMDRIAEVASWTAQTPGGRPLIVLRGQGGHLLGVDDDGMFSLCPSVVHWSGEGHYRGAPAPDNAGNV